VTEPLGGRVVALSPHLDDAVWSVGATLADATRNGAEVTVVTVLAGDPASRAPAGRWDVQCGFRTGGKAAEVRREEDSRACVRIGATPVHLPFGDETYERGGSDDDVWATLEPLAAAADALLVPGFPLTHGDHDWLARLVVGHSRLSARLGLYAEQPYAMWQLKKGATLDVPESVKPNVGAASWRRARPTAAAFAAKIAAARAYESQLRAKRGPYHWLPVRLALHELARGGEAIAWIDPAP